MATVKAFPIVLADALTMALAQGSEFDCSVVAHFRSEWVFNYSNFKRTGCHRLVTFIAQFLAAPETVAIGGAYVALSRVRKFEQLYIEGLTRAHIKTSTFMKG